MILETFLKETNLPKQHDFPLPIGHLTDFDSLINIFTETMVSPPKKCPNFNQKITYCSYGQISYIKNIECMPGIHNVPVGLIFSSNLTQIIHSYYPLDTGAFFSGMIPEEWRTRLGDINDFRVSGNGDCNSEDSHSKLERNLIFNFYGSHSNYVSGHILEHHIAEHERLKLLQDFLVEVSNIKGIDMRGRTIECHITDEFKLLDYLEAVFIPIEHKIDYHRLIAKQMSTISRLPEVIYYSRHDLMDPGEMCTNIRNQAGLYISEKYVDIFSQISQHLIKQPSLMSRFLRRLRS